MTDPQPETLYALAARQWAQATARHAVDEDVAWLQADDGRQLQLVSEDGTFYIDPLEADTRTFAATGAWASPDGHGETIDFDKSDTPVPAGLVDLLAGALPIPLPGPIHGYRSDGRTTVLIFGWQADGAADDMRHACFMLRGTDKPEHLHRTGRDGQDFLDLAAWWQAVDAGQIVNLDAQVASSAAPVEMRRRRGFYQYVLVRGGQSWTGVDGPALYVHDTAEDITVEQALRLHGTDIRKVTRNALQVHGN
jgi:hypothetical protein